MKSARTAWLLFGLLACVLIAARLCHTGILWEGDTLPMAAAAQMRHGQALYREVWFDKPLLVPAFYLLSDVRPGWPVRIEDALYCLLACWMAYRFARDLWSEREGLWAAGLLGFFLVFDFPSAVIPVASDLLMLAPHLGAVWMAERRRGWVSGALAGIAFWISPKGLLVAVAAAAWYPAGIIPMIGGFGMVSGVAAGWLALTASLAAWWQEVWIWGRLYAASPLAGAPLANGLVRTLNWIGFHAAIVIAAGRFLAERVPFRWLVWLGASAAGVALGLRFFPRYYFELLPVVVIMAARGFCLLGRTRAIVALLLLIPATRFGPDYLYAVTDPAWRDVAMDRDSRAAAAFLRVHAQPGETLFIWGYRPELYVYSHLPAATLWLDSQPLTGVPADRHLSSSTPIETAAAARRRAELAHTHPDWVVDGLGPYNPSLAITRYPGLKVWLSHYRELATIGQAVIYQRLPDR